MVNMHTNGLPPDAQLLVRWLNPEPIRDTLYGSWSDSPAEFLEDDRIHEYDGSRSLGIEVGSRAGGFRRFGG